MSVSELMCLMGGPMIIDRTYLVMPVACPLLGVSRAPLASEVLLICESCEWTGFRGRGRRMRSGCPFETSAEVDAMMSAAGHQNRPGCCALSPLSHFQCAVSAAR